MVRSKGRMWSSMENSRCQSVGFALSAAAYDALVDNDARGALLERPSFVDELGVATRVPSGVCASILEPSGITSMI